MRESRHFEKLAKKIFVSYYSYLCAFPLFHMAIWAFKRSFIDEKHKKKIEAFLTRAILSRMDADTI